MSVRPDLRPIWSLCRSREEFGGASELPLLTVTSGAGVGIRDLSGGRAPSEETSKYRVVRSGDLVVNKMWARFGAYGVSDFDGIISPAYWVLTLADHQIVPRFMHHVLRSSSYRAEIWRRSKDLPPNGFDIPWEQFRTIRVPVPSLDAQRAVVHHLDTETARIDALIAKKVSMRELIVSRRMNVLTEALRGSFFDAGEVGTSPLPWLDVQPMAWPTAKLTFVASLGSGHTPSRQHPEWWADCTIPWITTGEVAQVRDDRQEVVTETREKISELGMANSSATLHPAGTVFLCRTASAGYSGIMGVDMATSQDFATWTCGPRLLPRFLLLCLRAMRQDLLGRLAMGSTHKTIYMPDIEALRIPLPSIADQQRVLDAVDERLFRLDEVVDGLTAQVRLLVEHRQALITAAVTGELEVPGVAA